MNKNWIALVAVGILLVVVVVGWDLFLTFTGQKSSFSYTLVPIGAELFGSTEEHLRADPQFGTYEELVSEN